MPDDTQAPEAEQTVLETAEQEVVEETTPPTETPETTPDETPETESVDWKARYEAEKGKTAKAVEAEKKARTARQALETELTDHRTKAEAQEAERVANLTLGQKLAEETKKREAAETEASKVRGEWTDFRVTTQLEQAGFFTGLDGEAKTAQLGTLKALTTLDFVQDDGQFSVEKFAARFGGLKPQTVAPTPPADPPVVDLGGKTSPPAEQQVARKAELLKALP